ncbi:MAG: hypothetical protein Q7T86_17270 [Hyphomicrobiaceae bacterium]|nr:hypothetical protein [Hyphomicrobiaceae bacterium]
MGWFKPQHKDVSDSSQLAATAVREVIDEPMPVDFRTGFEPVQNRFASDSDPTAAQSNRRAPRRRPPKFSRPIEHVNAATQAAALLQLLQEESDRFPGQMIGFAEIYKTYIEMCWQNHWREQGWAKVGREYNRLTTNGVKVYAMFYDEDGRGRRLRVYPLPPAEP